MSAVINQGQVAANTLYTVVAADYAPVLAAAAVARGAWVCLEPWPDDHCPGARKT